MGKILIIKNADFSNVAVGRVTPVIDKVRITVNASPSEGGTVTGGGLYDEGASVTITATAASGYRFVRWNDGNTSASRTITANSATTYTAIFEDISTHVLTSEEAGFVAEGAFSTQTITGGTTGERNVKLITHATRSRCLIDMLALKNAGYRTLTITRVSGNPAAVGSDVLLTNEYQHAFTLDVQGVATDDFGFRYGPFVIDLTTYAYRYLYLQLQDSTTGAYSTDWSIVATL